MPAPRGTIEEKHVHNWYPNRDGVSAHCLNRYGNYPCKAIKVGIRELERREAEWDNYYKLCQETEPKKNYEEMREIFRTGNRSKMKEARERISKRCKVVVDEFGDNIYTYSESQYMQGPNFPDPRDPKEVYIIA